MQRITQSVFNRVEGRGKKSRNLENLFFCRVLSTCLILIETTFEITIFEKKQEWH